MGFPNSYSTSVLMVDQNLTNSQFNITSFLNSITRQNEHNENVTDSFITSQPDIANQDDLLLISELLILSFLLLIFNFF